MTTEGDKTGGWKATAGWVVLLALTVLGAWYRFTDLTLKPMHHDEGVNAQFMEGLLDSFTYKYNPFNFHGPLLYFLTAPVAKIYGLTPLGMRVAPALFGTLAIPAMVLFRRRIGWLGVLVSAALVAVAPVEVYFSKTAIHEIYNFTFNLTFVGGFWLWWQTGRRSALWLGAASLAALFATKETTIITLAATIPSLMVAWMVARPAPGWIAGDPVPSPALASMPAFLARRLRRAQSEEAPTTGWLRQDAPAPVAEAAARLDEALATVRAAAREVIDAHRVAEAQAQVAGLPPPPPLPWSVREEALDTSGTTVAPGQTWPMRVFLYVMALVIGGATYVAFPIVVEKLKITAPDQARWGSTGGAAAVVMLLATLAPRGLLVAIRPLLAPFIFLREAWLHDRRGSRIALVLLVGLLVVLFTSFFTHPQGVVKFFQAFFGWGKTGVEGQGHEKIWTYWMAELLWPYYKPLLFVGLPGLIVASLRRDAFAVFTLGWFVLALAAYSAIPYKTPWCVISFTGPLFIGVGVAVAELTRWASALSAPAARVALVGVPLLAGAYPAVSWAQESWRIQAEEYDVDAHAFIYVQNLREWMDMVSDVDGLMTTAQKTKGKAPSIWMVKARNPLRYYVEGIADAKGSPNWDEKAKKEAKKADIVMAQKSSARDVAQVMKGLPYVHRYYHERPGHGFEVYVKKDLWEAFEAAAARGEVTAPKPPSKKRTYSDERSAEIRKARRSR